MTRITVNFNFDGRCEEAIKLYQQAFGAKLGCFLRYSDGDPRDLHRELTEEQRNAVYHAELLIDGQRIMLADNFDVPFAPNPSLCLAVTMDTKEQVEAAFHAMEEGCTVYSPPHSTAYSSCTVNFMDRFGFRWVIMTEGTDK